MVTPALDESFATPVDAARLDRAAQALRDNGYTVHVVATAAEARTLVTSLVPRDQSVFTATSETLRLSGIAADLDESGDFRSVRANAGEPSGDAYDQIRLGATPDVVVGSVHAVTEEGQLVVGSASGSQLAPYASGARKAIWVVGAQKIVPDLETGIRRIRTHSAAAGARAAPAAVRTVVVPRPDPHPRAGGVPGPGHRGPDPGGHRVLTPGATGPGVTPAGGPGQARRPPASTGHARAGRPPSSLGDRSRHVHGHPHPEPPAVLARHHLAVPSARVRVFPSTAGYRRTSAYVCRGARTAHQARPVDAATGWGRHGARRGRARQARVTVEQLALAAARRRADPAARATTRRALARAHARTASAAQEFDDRVGQANTRDGPGCAHHLGEHADLPAATSGTGPVPRTRRPTPRGPGPGSTSATPTGPSGTSGPPAPRGARPCGPWTASTTPTRTGPTRRADGDAIRPRQPPVARMPGDTGDSAAWAGPRGVLSAARARALSRGVAGVTRVEHGDEGRSRTRRPVSAAPGGAGPPTPRRPARPARPGVTSFFPGPVGCWG